MKKNKRIKNLLHTAILRLLCILPFVAIDQLSKFGVRTYFQDVLYYKTLKITPFLNFTEVLNKGVAFGSFSGFTHSNSIFIGLTLLVLVYFLYLLLTSTHSVQNVCYGLIVSGAFGNLLDRVFHGAVYDFIDLHIGSWHWYTFNVADAYVCLGAVLFFFITFFKVR